MNPNFVHPIHNQAPVPQIPEAIPMDNAPLTEVQWGAQQQELNNLTFELSESHREEANINRFVAEGRMDPATAQQELAEVMANRYGTPTNPDAGIVGRIQWLANHSDTSAIIDILNQKAGIAQGNHRKGQEALFGPGGLDEAALAAEGSMNVEQARYHQTTRRHAVNPVRDPKSDAGAAEVKRRERVERRALGTSTGAIVAAGKAATERARGAYRQENSGDYHGDLGRIAAVMSNEHNIARSDLEAIDNDVNRELSTWSIRQTGESYPGQEQQMRADLEDMRTIIDRLSPHDALRAEAIANYNRMRYRLESRGTLDDDAQNTRRHGGTFTPDRGLLLHSGDPDHEVVLYEDGTTARGGRRTHPSGQEYVPAPAEEDVFHIDAEVPAHAAGRSAAELFNEWEANRTPTTEAVAYAALRDEIDRQAGARQANMDAIGQYQLGVTAQRDYIAQIRQAATNEGRALTANENTEIANANTQITRLQGMEASARQNVEQLNERINRASYWKNYLEVGKERVQVRTSGKFITRQVVTPVEGLAPEIRPNGSVLVSDATFNGIHQDEWYVFRSGVTAYFDRATRNYRYFRANGQPI